MRVIEILARGMACLLFLLLLVQTPSLAAEADCVIENAILHDGTGRAPVTGHVAMRDGVIISVGAGPGPQSEWKIDATGLIVVPGFIDLHTHSDKGIVQPETRAAVNYLLQGCTTSVTGNCGMGPIEVKTFYDQVDAAGAGTNVAHLLPQGTLRREVVGSVNRRATPEERKAMCQLIQKGMDEGAWGISTGLIYSPSTYADTEELIELSQVVQLAGGLYVSHIRGEEDRQLDSVQEALQIGRGANVPIHISHIKVKGTPNWGTLQAALKLIEQARAAGMKVTADQYPYTAASTSLAATIFPPWSLSGGTEQLIQRLDDPQTGERIRREVSQSLAIKEHGQQIVVAQYAKRPDWVGKHLREIAEAEDATPLQIAEIIMRNGGAQIVNFAMSEADVRLAMTYPWVATASDGEVFVPNANRPHPRSFGTFPRKIGYYSLQEQVLPLEQAIRSATGLPADIIGLKDRGYLKKGLAADIVVFDPHTFRETATFDDPYQYATGVQYVFVNGVPAVHKGGAHRGAGGQSFAQIGSPLMTFYSGSITSEHRKRQQASGECKLPVIQY